MTKLLLLDGNSLAYRAFFALPTDMATASGQVTNAVYGFTSMLVNLFKDHQPDAIAVAFDRPEPTFRHELVPDYKAGRSAAPDILRQQMGLVRQVVDALNIPIVDLAGMEADDVIATLASQARDRGDDVIVVTGDRDEFQLVEDPHVRVLYVLRGVSDYVLLDEAGVLERTGVLPNLYPQYAALRGDPSDNLPGVPGVGAKTAAKLINTYGDLDGVFAHLDECTPKLRQNLTEHEPIVRRNATATPLVRDAAVSCDPDELRMGGFDQEKLRELFKFLEFGPQLWGRLVEALGPEHIDEAPGSTGSGDLLEADVDRLDEAAAVALAKRIGSGDVAESPAVALAWEGVEGRSPVTGLAVAVGEAAVPWIEASVLSDPAVAKALTLALSTSSIEVHAHGSKEVMRGLATVGISFSCLGIDTAVAAYLIEPSENQYLLEDLARRHLGIELEPQGEGETKGQLALDVGGGSDRAMRAALRAEAVRRLVPELSAALEARGLANLYREIERPLVRVLHRMEETGIAVDAAYLKELSAGLTDEVRRLDVEIQELAGEPFKVNSTPQLREVLFVKLGLQPQKKTKTGFSTDAASLEKLVGQHPIIEKLLRYREVEKLRSTYGESLLSEVASDGRIHATFNQTVARTGRLSSDRPNLHNVPIRTEEGRRFRRAFVPREAWRLLVADYNQIELRIIAHLAEDPGLIEAFTSGHDVHTATASRIFGVEPGDVDLGQRSKAKMVSYGLAYGMESFGLAQRLRIPVEEAAEILAAYFIAFPTVKAYMERTVAEARERGYTETLFGRRRQIPELSATNFRVRQAGERQAMNAGIQGLAADIFKVALVRLDGEIESRGLESRLVLQVHDEVLLEVPPDEEVVAEQVTRDAMTGACELCVGLDVNLAWGDSWEDAKG
ncbi:MAG TPA: DNA polymerase I [Acidimicrobiales bacterium]|nr:DNA polymerase I [Acidimicrobiales bacterium]